MVTKEKSIKYENNIKDLDCKKKNFNKKLYIPYKIVSWDLLFYYAISFLFLNQVKGLDTAVIIFSESFYPIFKVILQIPSTIIAEKFGKKKTLILGNMFIFIYVILIMFSNSAPILIFANVFCAFGYIIKGMVESNILYDALENEKDSNGEFSKIDGKGTAIFYFVEAVTCFATGFLYTVNSYLPLILCATFSFIAIILSIFFRKLDTDKSNIQDGKEDTNIKSYMIDILDTFKFIIHSNRLKSLFLFIAVFSSINYIMITLRTSILDALGVSSNYIGILFAIFGIIAALSSTQANNIHNRNKNHSLGYIGTVYVLSAFFAATFAILNVNFVLKIFVIASMFALEYMVIGSYHVLNRRYLNSFADSDERLKLYSSALLIEGLTCAVVSFITSFVLNYVSNIITLFFISGIYVFVMFATLFYMKTRFGLHPSKYTDKDIYTL